MERINIHCHACGGCSLVCPEKGAIREVQRPVGLVETGYHQEIRVVTGVLDLGEASGVPVITAALRQADPEGLNIIDCPPGSACSVMESVTDADYCVLVAEPTAFGFHNFQMVYELVKLLHKPCGVVINKMDQPYEPLEAFCARSGLPVLERIPYSQKAAHLCAAGQVVSEADPETAQRFQDLLGKIGGAVS